MAAWTFGFYLEPRVKSLFFGANFIAKLEGAVPRQQSDQNQVSRNSFLPKKAQKQFDIAKFSPELVLRQNWGYTGVLAEPFGNYDARIVFGDFGVMQAEDSDCSVEG